MLRISTALILGALLLATMPAAALAQEEEGAVQAAVHAPNIPPSDYYLARNSLVELELLDTIDTASAKRNQVFHYRVTRDIRGQGGVVIPKDSEGTGLVRESRKGTKTEPGRLHLGFGEVPSVEGRPVKLGYLEPARRANEERGFPGNIVGIIGGYFESGERHVKLPAGTRLLTAVEFPYGTRRIKAGDDGTKYHLFTPDPVQER